MHDPKTLAEWIQLDYPQQPGFLRRLRSKAIVAAALLSLLAVGLLFVVGKPTAFQSGPVSDAHQMFHNSCSACHTESFGAIGRLASDQKPSMDTACAACHPGPPHHEDRAAFQGHCADCHREHRGELVLARVSDVWCTNCHADMPGKGVKPGMTSAIPAVSGFAPGKHPDFALWRLEKPRDPGTLRFNHEVHLASGGVLGPDRKPMALECGSCHQMAKERGPMQPVNYERHCAGCHALGVSVAGSWPDESARKAAEQFRAEPAPHKEPALVRAALRERYVQFARQHPNVTQDEPAQRSERPFPGERPDARASESEMAWAERQRERSERILFDGAAGCRYCHQLTTRAADRLPVFAKTSISERWLPHGKFEHHGHRMLDCTECHAARQSAKSADVLLPRVDNCQRCHNPAIGVRSDCVHCHDYHDHSHAAAFKKMTLEECLRMVGSNNK